MTNSTNQDDQWLDIKLSAKVFGHISQGLYRTPAGAIKELISNAFDADAKYVKIHTGFPTFTSFSCEDDGCGISREQFHQMMEQGMGSSEKRIQENAKTSKYQRPVIGRLGIGLLSLAQICTQFRLVSHHIKSKTAFDVTIRFPAYTKEELDKEKKNNKGYIVGGTYKFKTAIFEKTKAGVRIYTSSLRDSFRKRMKQLNERYAKKVHLKKSGPYNSFEQFIDCIYNSSPANKALSLSSDYDQLLFGLAMTAPVPYYESKDGQSNIILNTDLMKVQQERLKSFKFGVEVDNLSLLKPLLLPTNREGIMSQDCRVLPPKSHIFPLHDGGYKENVKIKKIPIQVGSQNIQYAVYLFQYSNQQVGGRPLKFSGYLFNQTGRLYPREIQGVLIRIQNVAIGGYDQSIMSYPYGEGPRFSMVSMEFFIEKGFEDSLNIDRDSFNGLDPHYMRVQSFVHSMMRTIFPQIWTEEKKRNLQLREEKEKKSQRNFESALGRTNPKGKVGKISVKEVTSTKSKPITFHKEGKIEVSPSHPLLQPILKRKKYRTLVQRVSIAFERALLEKNDERRRKAFYQILDDIFSE